MTRMMKMLMFTTVMAAVPARAAMDEDFAGLAPLRSGEWLVVKSDKRHDIFTYYKRDEGRRYRSFKAEARYDSSFDASACHLLDADNFKKWFMNAVESRLLKRISDTEFFMYVRFNAPLGVPDRDVVLHVVITPFNAKSGWLGVTFSDSPDYIPAIPGVVRIPAWEVVTRLMPLEDGRSFERTEGYVEPGGAPVPAWLVNYLQRQAPYNNTLGRARDMSRYESGVKPCSFRYRD